MKLTPIESSQTNIRVGLDIMGKVYTNARQWNGKFAQLQNQHQYPKDTKTKTKFGQALNNNLQKLKLNVVICGLCQVEKDKKEMEYLCKCHHPYCYSCLNSYAISKIEDLTPVKCPQQDCSESMLLTSNVYRYLPDTVKLKYLQNKHTFKVSKEEEANRCQRCLLQKHSGECKYTLSPTLVENSFKFRECPQCRVEISLTSGKRKVTCSRCQLSLCYLCGVKWSQGHNCVEKQKIRELERQNGYGGCCPCCCECCSYGCENNCVGCGDCCCRECGSCCLEDCCCGILFSCDDSPGLGCCLWNIFSIPIRMILTLFTIIVFSMLLGCCLAFTIFWLFLCLIGGSLAIAMETICNAPCPLNIVMLIFFPVMILYGFAVAVSETYKTPCQIVGELMEHFCEVMGAIWEELSPKRCSY